MRKVKVCIWKSQTVNLVSFGIYGYGNEEVTRRETAAAIGDRPKESDNIMNIR